MGVACMRLTSDMCATLQEYNVYNQAGFTDSLPKSPGLGAIYCRESSGAGHFSIGSLATSNQAMNCDYGSSAQYCSSGYGCNEQANPAVCCVDSPQCGDGIVQANEDCDSGSANGFGNACSNYCISRGC